MWGTVQPVHERKKKPKRREMVTIKNDDDVDDVQSHWYIRLKKMHFALIIAIARFHFRSADLAFAATRRIDTG